MILPYSSTTMAICSLPTSNFSNSLSILRFSGTIIILRLISFSFINGSNVKRVVLNYNGLERGSTLLNLEKNEVIVYDGSYRKYRNDYLKEYDTKLNNVPIFVQKKCSENVEKEVDN